MPDLYQIHTLYNFRLRMRDGVHLSANLWLPVPKTEGETFPAILEMIPYRKDDWRHNRDAQHGHYFASRGFAFCRLDVRGTGSSEGLALDEYTQAETQDGYEVVEWLAAQERCNGNVGMWGISYGGFTSIQVAILQPPHLKAIVPMYATDDRYLDDVHYIGGCLTVSELAQYAVSMVGMNALPPRLDYTSNWAEQWKQRLEHTPPLLIEWIKRQTDGPYWRNGSLAPDYSRIKCPIFSIAGWMDGYPSPALRMHQHCTAPRKTLVGNWTHTYPASGYPGPNLDHLHEMEHFFARWLKEEKNDVMDPPFTFFLREYTEPRAFPEQFNGQWASANNFPLEETQPLILYLADSSLSRQPLLDSRSHLIRHKPTHGTRASLCWGSGAAPTGLARDLRPDEALLPTYTTEPLAERLDFVGFPEVILHLSCSHPVATAVVRLTDVAPDGTSSFVTGCILNLTHRNSHSEPQPLIPDHIYEVHILFKGTAYCFLPGHRIRISVASGAWPVLWPSPYPSILTLHQGKEYPSRLVLPSVPANSYLSPPAFKTTLPDLPAVGGSDDAPSEWQIVEDVINDTVMVKVYDGGTTVMPDGRSLFSGERIEMMAHNTDPLRTRLYNEVIYRLDEQGYKTEIISTGSIRCTETEFVVDIQLRAMLNGNLFFQKTWLESVPRILV
ncbi:MAG TPA: CocE/NonD family hydrolase [Anaerolineales bacterium]|nr:CocE/NonD family hydrolase [Anaerolineales bacterium]